MGLKSYLVLLFSGLISGVIGLITIMSTVNPEEAGPTGLALVFAAMYFVFLCGFSLVGFYFRVKLLKKEALFASLKSSFRQGAILASIAVFMMMLQSLRLLTWRDGLLLFTAACLIEFSIYSKKRHNT